MPGLTDYRGRSEGAGEYGGLRAPQYFFIFFWLDGISYQGRWLMRPMSRRVMADVASYMRGVPESPWIDPIWSLGLEIGSDMAYILERLTISIASLSGVILDGRRPTFPNSRIKDGMQAWVAVMRYPSMYLGIYLGTYLGSEGARDRYPRAQACQLGSTKYTSLSPHRGRSVPGLLYLRVILQLSDQAQLRGVVSRVQSRLETDKPS